MSLRVKISDENVKTMEEQVEPKAKEQKGKTMEEQVGPEPGEAVATAPNTEEVKQTHEEMSNVTPAECPALMNKE